MSLSDDDDDAAIRSGPTAIDLAGPFDATDRDVVPAAPRATQISADPPTGVVRMGSFRELPPGTVVDDTYEIDAKLGAGAMGEVYAAHHMKLGKRVAIKVIGRRLSEDDAAIERFAMEARTLAKIQHPAIVAIEHIGDLPDGRAYFVMEFLRGESLFDRLQRGRVPLPEALRILDQMARGLEAAHGEGVIHRDLKPENTFLVHLSGEPSAVKLVDFGLSKLTADRAADDQRAERTGSGVPIGTPMYMSPEQARGQGVDHRTDIYALGIVAYELLLGQPPFPDAHSVAELFAAHLTETPPLPRSIWPEIPTPLDLALFAMLAKDPASRPTLEQIRSVLADASTSTSEKRVPTEFVGLRAARHRRRYLAIAAIVILALIGGVTIGMTVGSRPNAAPVAVPTRPTPGADAAPPIVTPVAIPVKGPVTVDLKPAAVVRRNAGSASRPRTERQPPKLGNVAPVDAGVDGAAPAPPTPPTPPMPPMIDKPVPKDKPVDRNQTINPFAKKHPKVNP